MELREFLADPATAPRRKTPLNAMHRAMGAKMVDFGGWEMPVEYPATGGLVAEHKSVRGVWACLTSATWATFEFMAGSCQAALLRRCSTSR